MKKLLPLLVLVLLIPSQASAMTWPIWGTILSPTPTTAVTRMLACMSGSNSSTLQTTAATARTPVSTGFTIANARMDMDTAPGVGNTIEAQLFVNGSGTNIDMTISGTNVAQTDPDSATITAGQTCYWQITTTGTPTAGKFSISAGATGTTDGEFTVAGGTQVTVSNSATTYLPIGMISGLVTVETDASVISPISGTIDDLQVELDGTVAGVTTYTITLVKNGTPTGLLCIVSVAGPTCSDLVGADAVTVSPGDYLSVQVVPSGTPTVRRVHHSFRIRPTTNGQSVVWTRSTGASNAGTRTQSIMGGSNVGNAGATDVSSSAAAAIGFTMSNLYVAVQPAPGSGKSWTLSSRINAGVGLLSAAIADSAIDNFDTNPAHADSINAGDVINWRSVPAGTPTAVTKMIEAAIAYVAPPATGSAPSIVGLIRAFWIQ